MLGVIIHWDHKPGLDDIGKRNLFQHYDYVCRGFGVDKLVIVDVNGTMSLSPPHPVVRTLDAAIAHFPSETPVCGIHAAGAELIGRYRHPEDVIYVTGPDFSSFSLTGRFDSVSIPLADPLLELWADQALAIVLADRSVLARLINTKGH